MNPLNFILSKLKEEKTHKIIFIVLFIITISLGTARYLITGNIMGCDGMQHYMTARSLFFDKNADIREELSYFEKQTSSFTGNPKPVWRRIDKNTGRIHQVYPIGMSIAILPFFLPAHIITILLNSLFKLNINADGYSIFYQLFTSWGSALYSFIALLLSYKLLNKIFKYSFYSFLSVLIIWLASPVLFYMSFDPMYTHNVTFFLITILIYLLYKYKNDIPIFIWGIMGFVGGFATIVHYDNVFFLLIPGLWALFAILLSFDRSISINKRLNIFLKLLIYTIFAIFGWGIQIYFNYWCTGKLFLITQHENTMLGLSLFEFLFNYLSGLNLKILSGHLFSVHDGLFLWFPIVILSFIGLFIYAKKEKLLTLLYLITFILVLFTLGSFSATLEGFIFANRFLISFSLIFSIGFACYFNYLKDININIDIFNVVYIIFQIITLGLLMIIKSLGLKYNYINKLINPFLTFHAITGYLGVLINIFFLFKYKTKNS